MADFVMTPSNNKLEDSLVPLEDGNLPPPHSPGPIWFLRAYAPPDLFRKDPNRRRLSFQFHRAYSPGSTPPLHLLHHHLPRLHKYSDERFVAALIERLEDIELDTDGTVMRIPAFYAANNETTPSSYDSPSPETQERRDKELDEASRAMIRQTLKDKRPLYHWPEERGLPYDGYGRPVIPGQTVEHPLQALVAEVLEEMGLPADHYPPPITTKEREEIALSARQAHEHTPESLRTAGSPLMMKVTLEQPNMAPSRKRPRSEEEDGRHDTSQVDQQQKASQPMKRRKIRATRPTVPVSTRCTRSMTRAMHDAKMLA